MASVGIQGAVYIADLLQQGRSIVPTVIITPCLVKWGFLKKYKFLVQNSLILSSIVSHRHLADLVILHNLEKRRTMSNVIVKL